MPPTRRCRPATHVARTRPAALPLRTIEDALSVVLEAGDPERRQIVCLLLDRARCGLACLVIAAPDDEWPLADVADLVIEAARSDTGIAAVVLASLVPEPWSLPGPAKHVRFYGLRARFAAAGVDLLDWLIIAGGYAGSLAELAGARPLWDAS